MQNVLEKEDFLENVYVLSCFVQLESILLISCVFWIFSVTASAFNQRGYSLKFLQHKPVLKQLPRQHACGAHDGILWRQAADDFCQRFFTSHREPGKNRENMSHLWNILVQP